MKILCNYLGGSISYGLNTPLSDRDERYIFVHNDISKIIGLDKHEYESKQTDGDDKFGWDLRHFLKLLSNGNTMCLEMLYNDSWIECTSEFKHIQSKRKSLINSHKLFKCLMGYCHSERDFAIGKRTGVLGGKRKGHLDKFGYSYKNAVQFLRLCFCGKEFFQTGIFPVNTSLFAEHQLLFDIKTNPQNYNIDQIIVLMNSYDEMLKESYNNIKIIYDFNLEIANQICYDVYMPILEQYNTKIKL